jgi:hypothetical protein
MPLLAGQPSHHPLAGYCPMHQPSDVLMIERSPQPAQHPLPSRTRPGRPWPDREYPRGRRRRPTNPTRAHPKPPPTHRPDEATKPPLGDRFPATHDHTTSRSHQHPYNVSHHPASPRPRASRPPPLRSMPHVASSPSDPRAARSTRLAARGSRDSGADALVRQAGPADHPGSWHCSDAVTRGRAIAFTRRGSGRSRVRGRSACSLPVSTASSRDYVWSPKRSPRPNGA